MMKIVIHAPNWIGDAVLCTPALRILGRGFPEAEITILARGEVGEIFLNNPDIDDVIPLMAGNFRTIVGELRRRGFDMGLLFPNSFSSAFLLYRAGVKRRIGYSTDGRSLLLTHRLRPSSDWRKEHQVRYYLNLMEGVAEVRGQPAPAQRSGPGKSEVKLIWKVSEEEDEETERILASYGLGGNEDMVGISPGAAYGPAKTWFPDRFAEVGDRLISDGLKIILFGNRREIPVGRDIERLMAGEPINLMGKTTLRQMAALIRKCNTFLTNDSGPMHIASALGTPVVAIFGSTDPGRTGPLGKGHTVITSNLECSPCFRRICPRGKPECFSAVGVDEVLEAVRKSKSYFPLPQGERGI